MAAAAESDKDGADAGILSVLELHTRGRLAAPIAYLVHLGASVDFFFFYCDSIVLGSDVRTWIERAKTALPWRGKKIARGMGIYVWLFGLFDFYQVAALHN